jgi:hypothetical protein
MSRQDSLRNREDMPSACTMFTAVLFIAGGLIPFARVGFEESLIYPYGITGLREKDRISALLSECGKTSRASNLGPTRLRGELSNGTRRVPLLRLRLNPATENRLQTPSGLRHTRDYIRLCP